MKTKFFCLLLGICLLFALTPLSALGEETKQYNWFFKSSGNDRPQLLGGETFWQDYGALALGAPEEKVLYLTFDAGYENGNVTKILDVLKKHDAKGAFFILPGLVKYAPETVMRMANEGHTVCNHSTSHRNMASVTDKAAFQKELTGIEEAYTNLTGRSLAKFFRPPEGSFSKTTLQFCKELGYTPVFWSYAYADWDNNAQMTHEKALTGLLNHLHNGEILLLHPTSATNAAILDDFLTEVKKRGYRLGTLEELIHAPTLSVQEYQQQGLVFCENPDADKCLALTFDDGPHGTQTEQVLAVLEKYGVSATFFPIGENAARHPELIRKIKAAGHEIGNHTYTHCTVSKVSEKTLKQEILRTEAVLKEQCGVTPRLFRPPGGDISEKAVRLVNQMGYRYVLWSWRVDTRDWASVSVQSVVDTVMNNVTDGNIILFHDYVSGKSPTAAALEILIPKLLAEGYRFVTVSDLATL